MQRWISPIFLLACGEQVIEKQENSAPLVLLVSHSDGAEVQEGYAESFRATISDDDNEFSEIQAVWYVGDEIVCDWAELSPAGDTTCQIVFDADDTNVIVEARDPQGSGGRAEVSIIVFPTEAPVIALLTPEAGQAYYSNQLIQFSGMVSDNEDANEDLIVTWTSSVDGELVLETTPDSTGLISDYTYLSEGQHAIELRVQDSSNKVSTAEVVLQVGGENAIPQCVITEPASQSAAVVGDTVIFMGTATDDDIPNTDLMVEWISDKDGVLGLSTPSTSGAVSFAYSALTADTHTISMNVRDEIGSLCAEQILLTIGNPPNAVITAPSDGAILAVGNPIIFQADVSDPEDQPSEILVEWISSLDGTMHSSVANAQGTAQFPTSGLSAGLHSISLTATDSSGLMADDLITIRVNTPPTAPNITLSPDPVYSMNSLVAMASGSVDGDGDNVSYRYEWYENGFLTSYTGTTISAIELDVGELWTVRVTPNDGWMDGNYTEASITVTNSEPVISGVIISPNTGIYNDSTLTCSAIATDADGAVTPAYQWYLPSGMAFGASINLANFTIVPGDNIECMAAVNDGFTLVTSTASALVGNRAPVANSAAIASSDPSGLAYYDSALTCSLNFSEPDNESPTESYQWEVNGVVVGSSSGLDLSSISISPGDTIECIGTATDATGEFDSASTSVILENTAPSLSLNFTPAYPDFTDVVTCTATAIDPEGENLIYNFSFFEQGTGASFAPTTVNGSEATLNVDDTSLFSNDILVCEVTVIDISGGSTTEQSSVIVANTAPVFTSLVTITPSTGVTAGTSLTCSATAEDTTSGIIIPTYAWTLNGFLLQSGDTYVVDAGQTNVNETIVCMATASDGSSATQASASVVVENATPSVDSLSILAPNGLYNDQMIECFATASDIDQTAIITGYTWSSNGVNLGFGATLDLSTTALFPSDPIECIVAVTDGFDTIYDIVSESVEDRAPSPPAISISWSGAGSLPLPGEDLTCTGSGSIDPDGTSVSYSYLWTSDFGGSVSGQTVSGSMTFENETWDCEVTAISGLLSTGLVDSIMIESLWEGDRNFTTCSQTGAFGPDQTLCDSAYSGSTLEGEVTISGGIQSWTVPNDGTYTIEAMGARGGNKGSGTGGAGAWIVGDFTLTAGDILTIHVGQKGRDYPGNSSTEGSGGGGGSFVFLNGTAILIAGGGGGTSYQQHSGSGGSATEYSIGGGYGTSNSGQGGGSGNNGGGGTGAGGGGLYGTGAGNSWTTGGAAAGGQGGDSDYLIWGGFGGGGGSFHGGGGGGGYTGGGGGMYTIGGGGGGSYNSGANPSNIASYNAGDGLVIISLP